MFTNKKPAIFTIHRIPCSFIKLPWEKWRSMQISKWWIHEREWKCKGI